VGKAKDVIEVDVAVTRGGVSNGVETRGGMVAVATRETWKMMMVAQF